MLGPWVREGRANDACGDRVDVNTGARFGRRFTGRVPESGYVQGNAS